MCDPFTLLAGVSAAVTAAGSLVRGIGNSDAAKIQAATARGNVPLIHKQGLVKENQLRNQVERVIGAQRAHFGARNIDPAYGSPLLMAAFSQSQGEVDARLIRADTIVQAAGAEAQAEALTAEAKQQRIAGWFGAASSVLTAGAKTWSTMPSRSPAIAGATQGDGVANPFGIY